MKMFRVDYRPQHEEIRYSFVLARTANQARDCIDKNYIIPFGRVQVGNRPVEDIIRITEIPMANAGIIGHNY